MTVTQSPARVSSLSHQIPEPGFYEGIVHHRRHRPKLHEFRYGVCLFWFNVDEPQQLFRYPGVLSSALLSLMRYRSNDYGTGEACSLSSQVRERVRQQVGVAVDGPVYLLTQVRNLGYIFNPLSIYYCYNSQHQLVATVSEVTNTPWGERFWYVNEYAPHDAVCRHQCAKQFHVSPFMEMEQTYQWRMTRPGKRLSVHLASQDNDGRMFESTLVLKHRAMHVSLIPRLLSRWSVMTLRITAAIYWQAVRLWLKRIPFVPHPDKQTSAATVPATTDLPVS